MRTLNTLLSLTLVVTALSFGQTNTFPSTGNAIIGTNNNLILPGLPSAVYFGGLDPENTYFPKIAGYGADLNFFSSANFKFNIGRDDDSVYYRGMTLDNWGTLYIGESTPINPGEIIDTKLNVEGIIKSYVPKLLGTSLNNFQLLDERAGRVGNSMFNRLWSVRDVNGTNDWHSARLHDGISVDASFVTPRVDTRTWWERDPKDNIQSWGNAADTYLTINNGNVGIGTTTPESRLDVYTQLPAIGGYDSQKWSTNNSNYNLKLQTVWNGGGINQEFVQRFNGTDYPSLTFYQGRIGIGTSIPDEKLTVNGTIHATEVKVTATVPADYVFQKYYTGKSELKADYIMPTLAEIESFTKKNNHLPNIPSAKEMQANGMSLGEMNNLLLQKVEELTLYVIEQEKKSEQQHKDVEELKALVNALIAKKQ